jgi:predicted Zn-dependent peptidase
MDAQIILGFEGRAYHVRDFYASQILSMILGGGMSSRLFQEVREKRGLCYAIYSTAWGLKDAGLFGLHAATGAKLMGELIDVIGSELKRAAEEIPEPGEVARAKAQLKAGLLMGLESSAVRVEQMARHVLSHGRVLSSAELTRKVDAVTAKSLKAFAARLRHGAPSVAVVGSGRRSLKLAEQAQRTVRV